MDKKKDDIIKFTQLTMAKADWGRTFLGEMHHHQDVDGNKFVTGTVVINECQIWSLAEDKYKLSKNLDGLCKHILDFNLHARAGITSEIVGTLFFLN